MKRAGEEGKKMEGDPNARREAGKLHDVIILIVMTVSFLINSSFKYEVKGHLILARDFNQCGSRKVD